MTGQQRIASLKISTDEQSEMEQKIHLITTNTVTMPLHHISLIPLKAINQAINTKFSSDPNLSPVASQLYPRPLKHQKFVKEEVQNLAEAGLIERSISPYTTPIRVVPRKSKPGPPLAETERLALNYNNLNKQIPKIQTTQAKFKGSLVLIETAKIDHIWSKLKGAKYFSTLDITIFPYTLTQD